MKIANMIAENMYHGNANALVVDTVFFNFEEDFVEENIRCIPMIVRFKLDACGIKLKLGEWSKLDTRERHLLAVMKCARPGEVNNYRDYLRGLITERTGNGAADLPIEKNPAWDNTDVVPQLLKEKLQEFNWQLTTQQWKRLTNLQRFVLLKLCRPGHENKNFPIAMKEFGLV